ncbi:MAG: 2OG-Fe dioxygenase family protein [Sulfuricaulis sp.]
MTVCINVKIQDNIDVLYREIPRVDLGKLKTSFERIPLDPHFAPGYRCRTQSRFAIRNDGHLELLPAVPLYQTLDINPLQGYGGIYREYADVPRWLQDSPDFEALVNVWLSHVPCEVKTFSAHQIRTNGSGLPVPEGRHRDGYDWVGLYVVHRHNINPACAKSTIWWEKTEEILMQGVLQEGELLTIDDQMVTHYTTGLVPENPDDPSYRDVFIFTVPDHSAMLNAAIKG